MCEFIDFREDLPSPPKGYKYHPSYLDAWDKNHNPNSMVKICYDGPILILDNGIIEEIIE